MWKKSVIQTSVVLVVSPGTPGHWYNSEILLKTDIKPSYLTQPGGCELQPCFGHKHCGCQKNSFLPLYRVEKLPWIIGYGRSRMTWHHSVTGVKLKWPKPLHRQLMHLIFKTKAWFEVYMHGWLKANWGTFTILPWTVQSVNCVWTEKDFFYLLYYTKCNDKELFWFNCE